MAGRLPFCWIHQMSRIRRDREFGWWSAHMVNHWLPTVTRCYSETLLASIRIPILCDGPTGRSANDIAAHVSSRLLARPIPFQECDLSPCQHLYPSGEHTWWLSRLLWLWVTLMVHTMNRQWFDHSRSRWTMVTRANKVGCGSIHAEQLHGRWCTSVSMLVTWTDMLHSQFCRRSRRWSKREKQAYASRSDHLTRGGWCTFQCKLSDNRDEFDKDQQLLWSTIKCLDPGSGECRLLQRYIANNDSTSNSVDNELANTVSASNSYSISFAQYCDTVWDLEYGTDESSAFCSAGQWKCASDNYQCTNSRQCIPLKWLCNGVWDCNDGSDEEGLQLLDKLSPHNARAVSGKSLAALKHECTEANNARPFRNRCNRPSEYPCLPATIDPSPDLFNFSRHRPCVHLSKIGEYVSMRKRVKSYRWNVWCFRLAEYQIAMDRWTNATYCVGLLEHSLGLTFCVATSNRLDYWILSSAIHYGVRMATMRSCADICSHQSLGNGSVVMVR